MLTPRIFSLPQLKSTLRFSLLLVSSPICNSGYYNSEKKLQLYDVDARGDRRQSASIQEHVTYAGAVSAAAHSDSAVTARRINMIQEELWLILCKKSRR